MRLPGYRALAAFPVVFAAVAAVLLTTAPASAYPTMARALIELAKVLAVFGLWSAALAFAPGDYLRRGWGFLGLCFAFLLARDLWVVLAGGASPLILEIGRATLITSANASAVAGSWILARAWSVAGIELPGTRGMRGAAIAVASVLALLLAGPAIFDDVRRSIGHVDHLWTVASDLGDLVTLPVIAPVAMIAFAVRDGTLRWSWGLLAAGFSAWLLYDAALAVPDLFPIENPRPWLLAAELCRLFAATCECAAGLAQRRAVRELET